MEKIWNIRQIDAAQLEKLRHTGFPDILLKILVSRGICDDSSIERYFTPRSRYLFSPFVIDGVCAAVDRIFKAVEKEESIRVYGDRDVDGITSTVIMTETLRSFHKLVDYTVPVIEDGYGLNPDYLDVAARDGVKLIVTVDCGISNIAEVEYARKKGIEVIITDHHEPPSALPDAVAIVDPKLHDSCCPQKNIAGVGVAFKLAMALEMARCNRLSKPLIAFDLSDHDIAAIRFAPREGFQHMKTIDRNSLAGCVPVFYNEAERKTIGELMPEILTSASSDPALKAVFVDKIIAACIPDATGLSKDEIKRSLNLEEIEGGRALVLIYLKCLEAKLPAVKALWQRCLDILTIGTIADMVPLHGENRTFAQMGLKFVGKSKRLGLNSLFNALGWKNRQVTERDISFSIAPILNSSGRLRTAELAIELLSTSLAPKADELARQLFELNNERKRLGEDCYNTVKGFLIGQNDLVNDRILLVVAPIKNQGVTGIVATRLMLDYCRPVIVLLEDQGKYLGSARSFKDINIIEALNHCSKYLEKYGGHIGAAGLTMPFGNEQLFRASLRAYANQKINQSDLQPEWLIDSELPIDMIDEQFLKDILNFAPFGIDNPAPVFMAEGAPFQEIRKVGESKNHLRYKFKRSNGRSIFGIGFNLGDIMAPDVLRDGTCDLVFHVEPNDYNGVRSAQLMVLDCRIRGFK
ncbi:MAG: single-stranded-DNA-specific exonuclease RecJ [Candidatus Riflebacteria bacterium HGW-Riflebacteria-1]|jgi:single-stranded-DNA-specific exonuclease|nr:MAG: single-stranded-DNA-specific exonuclease RecJ [Candidatus Riflebacteria bacterium HGW-Riflebacteria-1]